MRSRRSSHSAQSVTIVQSPTSSSSSGSNKPSPPITPILDIQMERSLRPFSESFSDIQILRDIQDDPAAKEAYENLVLLATLDSINVNEISQNGMRGEESFLIENITDIKSVDPEWQDDEIEEICVISPKNRSSSSFLNLNDISVQRTAIPDFDVLRSMSSETHCEVLVARSHGDGRLYVVKTLRRNIVSEPSLHNQIRAEQACLRAVSENNGPFLPTLHRSFYDDERLYLITSHYSGGTLNDLLVRGKPHTLSSSHCQFYASEIVEALSFLHSIKIVHRNVNLENVFIDHEGHVILGNFSAAKLLLSTDTPKSCSVSICGSVDYQAPEMMLGWKYDYSVDCWAFGVLLCLLHYGQHPFADGENEVDPLVLMQHKILSGEAPAHPPQKMPFAEWDLVKKCLELNPHLRATMQQVKAHAYFSDIEWTRVNTRGYEAPYVPMTDGEFETKRTSVLTNTQGDNFLDLKMSPILDSEDASFEGFCYFHEPVTKTVVKKKSSQRPLSSIMRRRTSRHSVRAPENKGDSPAAEFPLSPCSGEVRSILRHPSLHFPGDSLSIADFPSIRRSMSRASMAASPRKLQKKRSSAVGATPRLSVLMNRRSMTSLLGIGSSDVKKDSPCVDPLGPSPRRSMNGISMSPVTPKLPAGVVQTGRGIGYSHTTQASRSKISLVSTKSNTCFGKIRLPSLNVLACKSADNLPRTRKDIMQQVYGSNWSLAHSTVTFGIPEGLGQRVDDEVVLPLPSK